MSELLNPTQQSKITIVLRNFEEDLRMVTYWLRGDEEQGILYRRRLRLSPEYFPGVLDRIEEVLRIIDRLAKDLNLSKKEEDSARIIMGKLSMDWVALSECHANDLRGSGSVHPDLAGALDPSIDRLAQIALELGVIFGRSPGNSNQ